MKTRFQILEMSDEFEPLMTAAQVAERIGLAKSSGARVVREWHNEGRFPAAIHESNFIRFKWSVVETALAKRAVENNPRRF